MESEKKADGMSSMVMSLIVDNMLLRSQFMGLKNLIALVFLHPGEKISQRDVNLIYQKAVEAAGQEELLSHPSMETYWREQLEAALHGVPGIFLPKQKDSE